MRWKIDECPDAEGNWTLREDDGTEHGNTETCIATVYGGEQEQNLIESAPLLAEQVRILREALERVNSECDSTPHEDPHLCHAYDSVTAETVVAVRAALEATKEGA